MNYVATILVGETRFLTRITDLHIAESASGPVLFSATYLGGGLAGFAITDADLPVEPQGVWDYRANFGHMGDPELQTLDLGGQDSLVLTGMKNGPLYHLPLLESGGLGPAQPLYGATPLPRDLTQLGQIEIGGQAFLYAARRGEVEFSLYRTQADGQLVRAAQSLMPLAATMPEASLDRMITVGLGGQTVLIAVSGLGNFLSSQRIDGQGNIIRADYLKVRDGTGFNIPNDVAAVTVNGQVYLVVTSATASSITTVRLLPNGSMIPVDHIVDELTTRFQGATALATVEVEGRAYVFVGGVDDGISMFTVLPDGRLLHLETLADDPVMTLSDVSAIAAREVAGRIVLFVSSASEGGITQLAVDPGQIGLTGRAGSGTVEGGAGDDMLRAGRGTTHLKGGDGDDVLITWREDIMVWGGSGRDVFVATPIRGRILIWDYDPGEDRLDLSQLGMIRSVWQLSFSPFSKGIRIRFGETLIEIHSALGGTLTADQFSNLMFPVAHYTPPYVETVIVGSARGDLLSAARGGSEVYGLAGHDVILGSQVEDLLLGGDGDDTISAGLSNDTLHGGAGNDRLRASGGHDQLSGGSGHDMLIGDGGDDLIRGDDGSDTLFGGTGRDTLIGGQGHDYLSGDAGDDLVQGGAGNDSLSGGDGNDRLVTSAGENLLSGGAGNDTLVATGGADRLSGGTGDDLIKAGGGDDMIEGGDGRDCILAGSGNDRINGQSGDDSIRGDAGNDLIHAESGNDSVDGGDGHDTVHGGPGDDLLLGGEGNDLMDAGFGDDAIEGGDGDDTLIGVAGRNRLDGGAGCDFIQGDGQADTLLGGDDEDTVFGHGGGDRLEGGGGHDLLLAGSGADELLGGQGHDTLFGGEDADTLWGEADHDLLNGDAGDDLLFGGDGQDILQGGDGQDRIEGGAGADLMFGGAGADRFVFLSAAHSTPAETDRIGDFQSGADLIDLSGFGLDYIGEQPFTAALQLRLVVAADHMLLQADLDGDGLADLVIRIEGVIAFTQDDLLL